MTTPMITLHPFAALIFANFQVVLPAMKVEGTIIVSPIDIYTLNGKVKDGHKIVFA